MKGDRSTTTLLLALLCWAGHVLQAAGFSEFTPSPSTRLTRVAVNGETGTVYIGGVNKLYQLDGELRVRHTVQTGPVNDNALCPPSTASNSDPTCPIGGTPVAKALTNNANKIMVVDQTRRKLITCGSVFQGTCETRNLENITNSTTYRRDSNQYFVAANAEEASTVAMIAPGPLRHDDVLYVANTYSVGSDHALAYIRKEVPDLSSRRLDARNIFKLSQRDPRSPSNSTYISLGPESRASYLVNYVTVFSHGGFTYFLTNQPREFSKFGDFPPYVTKIIRICQRSTNFTSYTEMPLRCYDNRNRVDYSLLQDAYLSYPSSDIRNRYGIPADEPVVYGTFTTSDTPNDKPRPTSKSAVCMFRLRDIQRKFTENIQQCFNGQLDPRAPQFHGGERKCWSAKQMGYLQISIDDNYCGAYLFNYPIVGKIPVTAEPFFTRSNTKLTSIAVATVEQHTIMFIGTGHGHLLKVKEQSRVYADLTLDPGTEVKKGLTYDPSGSNLYVLTENKVVKLPVEQCGQYTSCTECSQSQDPYCGWCSLQNKCSLKSECQRSNLVDRWIPAGHSCITILSLTPNIIPRQTQTQVVMKLKNLPPVVKKENYMCVFEHGSESFTTKASLHSANEVICSSPPTLQLPPTPPGLDYMNTTVALKSSSTEVSFISTHLTIYDCAAHTSCTQCTKSRWPCNWCIHDNRCTHNTTTCQSEIIPGIRTSSPSSRKGSDFCPQMAPLSGNEILLPDGERKSILLRARNLPVPKKGQSGYECIIHRGTVPIRVPARRLNGSAVMCNRFKFSYAERVEKRMIPLSVVWNKDHFIDDSHTITVTMYKCGQMATDCSRCLSHVSTDPKYECSWCGQTCSYRRSCRAHAEQVCPPPTLEKVYPLSSPIEGGTNVTITGIDLGREYSDVVTAVSLAGVECKPYAQLYDVSHKIVCKTMQSVSPVSGAINVTVRGQTTQWPANFTFQDPRLESISPTIGPSSGGTEVVVRGKELDTGANIRIFLDGIQCIFNRSTVEPEKVKCTTQSAARPQQTRVLQMTFDGSRRTILQKFMFTKDPTITSIFPLKSISSGGRQIQVFGENLTSIRKPKMLLILDRGTESQPAECMVRNSTYMTCKSPYLHKIPTSARSNKKTLDTEIKTTSAQIAFIMDGVEEVRNLSRYFPNVDSVMTYVPDPVFHPFKENQKIYNGEALNIQGTNLNLANTKEEVKVTIGGEICRVTGLALEWLVCIPPKPSADNEVLKEQSEAPVVKIKVGRLSFEIGRLLYPSNKRPLTASATQWMDAMTHFLPIIVVGVIGLLGIIILIPILFYINKRKQRKQGNTIYTQCETELLEGLAAMTGSHYDDVILPPPAPWMDDSGLKQLIQSLLVDKRRLQLGAIIGKGCFGLVYEGMLKDTQNDNLSKVAIKTLQGLRVSPDDIISFLREALLMKDFQHANVLSLIGISMSDGHIPMVILPYMGNGDLRTYISNPAKSFTIRDLMEFSLQVAEGMAYLEAHKFVHRDLAARNCMVDECNIVKVADFGLSRDIYTKDYYSSKDKDAKLPVRWMALESLTNRIYNYKTDVWSFGVLFWELMTRGVTPYPDVGNWEIRDYLEAGNRLRRPEWCPDVVYDLMVHCWEIDPVDRPSFRQLVAEIKQIITCKEKSETDVYQLYINVHVPQPAINIMPPGYGDEDDLDHNIAAPQRVRRSSWIYDDDDDDLVSAPPVFGSAGEKIPNRWNNEQSYLLENAQNAQTLRGEIVTGKGLFGLPGETVFYKDSIAEEPSEPGPLRDRLNSTGQYLNLHCDQRKSLPNSGNAPPKKPTSLHHSLSMPASAKDRKDLAVLAPPPLALVKNLSQDYCQMHGNRNTRLSSSDGLPNPGYRDSQDSDYVSSGSVTTLDLSPTSV